MAGTFQRLITPMTLKFSQDVTLMFLQRRSSLVKITIPNYAPWLSFFMFYFLQQLHNDDSSDQAEFSQNVTLIFQQGV